LRIGSDLPICAIKHIVVLQRCRVLWTLYFAGCCTLQQQQHDDVSVKKMGEIVLGLLK